MGTKTGIEWTDSTWSPIRYRVKQDAAKIAKEKGYTSLVTIAEKMAGRVGQHCEHASPGCLNCYAETNNHRCLPANGTGLPYDRRSRDLVEPYIDEKALLQPLKWGPVLTGIARGEGALVHKVHRDGCISVTRQRSRSIFVENQSDLFGEWVPDELIDRSLAVGIVSGHILQLLTKRAKRLRDYFSDPETPNRIADLVEGLTDEFAFAWPYPHFWLGVSVENQAAADERIPLLLQTPAAVRFISAEPLLGAVNLGYGFADGLPVFRSAKGARIKGIPGGNDLGEIPEGWYRHHGNIHPWLDWVICGGESGHGARRMEAVWAQSLRDQCAAAGVPFFMKQMGSVYGKCRGHDLPADLDIKQFPEVRA